MMTTWESYEDVATYLLNQCAGEFGLSRVEGKQKITGILSETEWEIDAKGICQGNEGFVIIECRRYTKQKQNQEKVGALAWRIHDTGAYSGIIVSPLGLQEGADKVARAGKIVSVQLSPNSTPMEFTMQFLNKIFIGIRDQVNVQDTASVELIRTCSKCGQKFSVLENEKRCSECTHVNP